MYQSSTTHHNNRNHKQIGLILAAIFVAAALIVGLTLFAYHRGQVAGETSQQAKLTALASAIQEKSDYITQLDNLYHGWTADTETIDKTGIDNYITNLKTLIASTNNAEIKSALETYLSEWQNLQTIYDQKDNEAIMQAFESIKTTATTTATKIQQILDQNITTAIENLEI